MTISDVTSLIPVLDPIGPTRERDVFPAPRLSSLAGAKLGVLENGKGNDQIFLMAVASLLESSFGMQVTIERRKPSAALPAPPELIAEIAESAEAVITGPGDCGACSSYSTYDAVELERLGVPTVCICSDQFEALADVQRLGLGLPELSLAIVPYPISAIDEDRASDKGRSIAPAVASMFTTGLAS